MSVTLAEFARHLGRTAPPDGAPEHDDLQRVLSAAQGIVEDRCGPLTATPRTYRVTPSGRCLVLPAWHLTSVSEVRDPDGTVVAHDAKGTNLAAGIVAVPSGARAAAGLWEVDAVRADDSTPAALELAVYIIGKHLWETQRGTGVRGGALGADPAPPVGFAIPRRAAELMDPYTLPALA